jgi:cathepsin L
LKTTKLNAEKDYPYVNYNTESQKTTCKDKGQATKGVVSLKNFGENTRATVDSLKKQLAKGAVAVQVMADGWEHYVSGIYQATDCKNWSNHAVTAVGWGKDDKTGQDYWIIKNSWGTGWGEQGYMRLAIEHSKQDGTCGVREQIYWSEGLELHQ